MTPAQLSDLANGTVPSAVGVKMGLPSGWTKFDPSDGDDLAAAINAVESVLEPLGQAGLLPEGVRLSAIAEQVAQTFRSMVGGHVLLAAGWATPVVVDGELELLAASLTVAVESIPALGGASDPEIHDALKEAAVDALRGTDALTSAHSFVDLPAGQAARLAWDDDRIAPWGGGTKPCRVVQFMLPVATTDAIVFLTCETSSIDRVEQIEPVFDAIATTLVPVII
jgi:hypothetical protein